MIAKELTAEKLNRRIKKEDTEAEMERRGNGELVTEYIDENGIMEVEEVKEVTRKNG